jgi:hypothetical protein
MGSGAALAKRVQNMAGRWKPRREDRTDADAVRREREFQQDLSDILEYGTEDDFVVALKNYKPDIGKEELQASIMQFRVYLREKRGLC